MERVKCCYEYDEHDFQCYYDIPYRIHTKEFEDTFEAGFKEISYTVENKTLWPKTMKHVGKLQLRDECGEPFNFQVNSEETYHSQIDTPKASILTRLLHWLSNIFV